MEQFCVRCGVAVAHEGGALVVTCPRCRERAAGGEVLYTVRTRDGATQGPLPAARVIEQLERGFLHREDLVAAPGEDLQPIQRHPDFAAWFVPGDTRHRALQAQVGRRRRRQAEHRAYLRRLRIGVLLAVVFALVAPWVATVTRVTVIPEPLVERAQERVVTAWRYATTLVRKALDEDVARQEIRENQEVPGAEVIAGARSRWGEVEGAAGPRVEAAWEQLLQGTAEGTHRARDLLEQALLAAPEDAAVAAGLAVAYARLAEAEPDLSRHAVEMLRRAEVLGAGDLPVVRGQAGVALANGAHEQAEERARACLARERSGGICWWILGEALAGQGRFEEARKALLEAGRALGDAPAVALSLARSALRTGDLATAGDRLETLASAFPEDGLIQELRARWLARVGRLDDALEAARRAGELDPKRVAARLLAAELELYHRGRPVEALRMLDALTGEDLTLFDDAARASLQLGNAALAAGSPERAVEAARRALELRSGWGLAHLLLARGLQATGDLAGAEDAIKAIAFHGLPHREAARAQDVVGRFYASQDRQRPARDALEAAWQADPDWPPARLHLVEVYLRLGAGRQALEALDALHLLDLDLERVRTPVVLTWLPEEDPVDLQGAIVEAIGSDARLARHLRRTHGILLALDCLGRDRPCGQARQVLESALAENDGDLVAHAMLARIDLVEGRNTEALARLTRVVSSQGDAAVLHALRALALHRLGRAGEADDALHRAIGADADALAPHRVAARIYADRGDWEQAGLELQAVLRVEPDDLSSTALLLEVQRGRAAAASPDLAVGEGEQ